MPKGVPGLTISTPSWRHAWLLFVISAAMLSVVLAQAPEQKPANAGDNAKAQEEVERAAAETRRPPPTINTMPFVQLAETGRMMVEAGRLGQDTTLDMSATAELNEDGSLKPESVKIEWRAPAANQEVTLFAQQLVTAISESKLLTVLRGYAKEVRLTARLDRENVALGLETELASAEEATKWASSYGALMFVGRKTKEGTPEGRLYEAVKVSSDGKVFSAAFEMPKVFAAKMVAEMLDKRAARRAAPPNQK